MITNPYIAFDGKGTPIDTIPDGSVTLEQYKTMTANTDGWRAILPKLTVEALAYYTQNHLNNSMLGSHFTDPTYDAALKHFVVPELLRRLNQDAVKSPASIDTDELRDHPLDRQHSDETYTLLNKAADEIDRLREKEQEDYKSICKAHVALNAHQKELDRLRQEATHWEQEARIAYQNLNAEQIKNQRVMRALDSVVPFLEKQGIIQTAWLVKKHLEKQMQGDNEQ